MQRSKGEWCSEDSCPGGVEPTEYGSADPCAGPLFLRGDRGATHTVHLGYTNSKRRSSYLKFYLRTSPLHTHKIYLPSSPRLRHIRSLHHRPCRLLRCLPAHHPAINAPTILSSETTSLAKEAFTVGILREGPNVSLSGLSTDPTHWS